MSTPLKVLAGFVAFGMSMNFIGSLHEKNAQLSGKLEQTETLNTCLALAAANPHMNVDCSSYTKAYDAESQYLLTSDPFKEQTNAVKATQERLRPSLQNTKSVNKKYTLCVSLYPGREADCAIQFGEN